MPASSRWSTTPRGRSGGWWVRRQADRGPPGPPHCLFCIVRALAPQKALPPASALERASPILLVEILEQLHVLLTIGRRRLFGPWGRQHLGARLGPDQR